MNETRHADFPNVVAERHIFGGCAPRGTMTPKFEPARDFSTVYSTYPPSFIVPCLLVRKLSCWQTNAQTNRCRWKRTSNATVGARAFPVAVAYIWNGLPADVSSAPSLPVSSQRLKTVRFHRNYPNICVVWTLFSLSDSGPSSIFHT